MGLVAVGGWLWATQLRRMAVYLGLVFGLWGLVCLIFSAPMPFEFMELLYWVPLAALHTSRTSRDYANTVWVAAAAGGAAVGFGLLGNDVAWVSVPVCAIVTAFAYFFYKRRVKEERSAGSVAPESCWLLTNRGLVPVDLEPGPECGNCGHPHIYIGYSVSGRVEVGAVEDAVIEVKPSEVPVELAVLTDVNGRHWLLPRA